MVSVLSFLLFKQLPEFLEGVFFNPGNIRPADMKLCCNFFLRLLFNPEKTIAKTDIPSGKGYLSGNRAESGCLPAQNTVPRYLQEDFRQYPKG